jgi:surfeit locus 1 family protein
MTRNLRALVVPGLLVLAAMVVLVSLGNWQMDRLAWKDDLIERVSQRPLLPPLDWQGKNEAAGLKQPFFGLANEYRRIVVDGEYLADKEARVFTSLPSETARGRESGPGYWIMTPFQISEAGYAVWVNRGFVPEGAEWSAPPRAARQSSG